MYPAHHFREADRCYRCISSSPDNGLHTPADANLLDVDGVHTLEGQGVSASTGIRGSLVSAGLGWIGFPEGGGGLWIIKIS